MKVINKFDGNYEFLSNFAGCNITDADGICYPTVENAFQANKTLDKDERLKFTTLTAAQAKKYGKCVKLRPNWEDIKVDVMRYLLFKKFTQPEFFELLMLTGDAELIEGNTWGDTFWGVCNGRGMNMLGSLLMEVRAVLRAETK